MSLWVYSSGKCSNRASEEADIEESVALLRPVLKCTAGHLPLDLCRLCNDTLNVFKGVLVIFMTWAHVDLTLLPPAEQYYFSLPHFIGNAAASVCFLGFMLAYGFACDGAYLSDWKERSATDRLQRMIRSAALPVVGAWCCAFGWGWMCFKLPLDWNTLIQILDFRLTLGNGPDFLLCFSVCMLVMFPLRQLVNLGLQREYTWRRRFCVLLLLGGPLIFTQLIVRDCTGVKKYFGYFLECTYRDAWSPVLPALPHLLYFNIGILLARTARALDADLKAGCGIDIFQLAVKAGGLALLALVFCYPLATVWAYNFGNLSVPTKWGPITRGFVDGPSVLWLLGNIFPVFAVLCLAFIFQYMVTSFAVGPLFWPIRALRAELANLGANVLLYLVIADLCLAGLYRGNYGQFPLDTQGCFLMTCGVIGIARFLQYLVASK
jgi:hypothetical protein|mmetsp:Transcript_96801/g.153251  ORF Transcript_96801/g.153251 Transcript_96801/m.153251 type:complete len:435 (-) Transcript_96801:63-1367(-)